MDSFSAEEYIGERFYTPRNGVSNPSLSRGVPKKSTDAYCSSLTFQHSTRSHDWVYTGINRNDYRVNSNFPNDYDHPIHNNHEVHAADEGHSLEHTKQESSFFFPRKRTIDAVDIETNPPKRYRGMNSLGLMPSSSPNADHYSSPRGRGNGKPSYGDKSEEASHHTPDIGRRYRESPLPTSQETSQAQNLMMGRLGSPFWENPSTNDSPNREPADEQAQRRIGHERDAAHLDSALKFEYSPRCASNDREGTSRAMHVHRVPKLGKNAINTQGSYAARTTNNDVNLGVVETSRRILTQISKDSIVKSGSTIPQTPNNRPPSNKHLDAHAYASERSFNSTQERSQRLSNAHGTSEELTNVVGESDQSDSTPVVRLFERLRYEQPCSEVDFNRSPYRAADILPHSSISYNERTATKTETPKTQDVSSRSGGRPTSPIYVDTPPGSPIKVTVVKTSIPMKDRLSSAKTKTSLKAKGDSLQDKQKRAAEMIIRKEQEVLDKEIFGEVVGESLEMEDHKMNFAYVEDQQKRDNEEKARLIEDIQRTADQEINRLRQETAEKERKQRELEEQRKKAKREAERQKQMAIDEAVKEERRQMAEEKIEASRRKEIADKERRDQEIVKAALMQADAAKRKELKYKREIARLQAASLKRSSVCSKQSKHRPDAPCHADEEEISLFVPEDYERSVEIVFQTM
jgi:hypothetical protein